MEKTRKCPYCGEEIMADAKKCKYCGEWLEEETIQEQKEAQGEAENSVRQENVTSEAPSAASKDSLFKTCFWEQITKHYCDFKGKLDRKTFWVCFLFYFLLMLVAAGISACLPMMGTILVLMLSLGLTLPYLGWIVRRLHDIGKEGGWIFIALLPFVGAIWLFVLLAKKGETRNVDKWKGKDTVITIVLAVVGLALYAIGLSSTSTSFARETLWQNKYHELSMNSTDEDVKTEIEKQVLDAYKTGEIYSLETPEFKAASFAMIESTPEGYVPCIDGDIYHGGIQDDFEGTVKIEKVEIVDENKAHVYVKLDFDSDYSEDETIVLVMLRDFNGQWLVDDVRENNSSIKSMMIECANSDLDDVPVDDGRDDYEEDIEDESTMDFGNISDRNYEENVLDKIVVIDGSELRLRLGPSTSSETLKWGDGSNRHPEVGEKFKYLGESGDFYKIDYKGNEVWVSRQFTHIESGNLDNNTQMSETKVVEEIVTTQTEEEIEEEIFKIVEEMPSFPGGEAKLMEFVGENIKYPQIARETGIQGRVFVNFVVEPDGSVSNVSVLRGIGGGCDEEAMRVIKSMPKWKPGKQRGKAVRVSYQIPVYFRL